MDENQKRFLLQAILAIDRLILVSNENTLEEVQENFMISDVLLLEFENLVNSIMRLDDNFINNHPEIPINQLRAVRNRIAHDYLSVSIEILYTTIDRNLKDLKKLLLKCIK